MSDKETADLLRMFRHMEIQNLEALRQSFVSELADHPAFSEKSIRLLDQVIAEHVQADSSAIHRKP